MIKFLQQLDRGVDKSDLAPVINLRTSYNGQKQSIEIRYEV